MKALHGELPFRSPRYATRAGAALMLAGGFLLWITVILPPAAQNSDAAIVAAGGLVIILGLILLWAEEAPPWIRLGCAFIGTIVITIAAYETGLGARGGENNAVLYVWPALYCSLFLPWGMAIAEFGLIVASYGALVFTADAASGALTRWLVTASTMFVVVLLVSRLRGNLDVSVGKLSHLAERDPLTGALNRRALLQLASVEFARSKATGDPVSVIAADLDNLKELNDVAGHAAGDLALRAVARALVENTRDGDSVARVGGDEFVILLPGASAEEARRVAGRLRSAPVHVEDVAGEHVHVSVGVATGAADLSFAAMWQAADEALYRFKRHGGKSPECVVLPDESLRGTAPAVA